jgi:hypothetical protein
MKRLPLILLHNWRAKLGSLAVATVLWLVIKHGIAYAPNSPPPPLPPPAAPMPVPLGTPG